MSAPRSLVKWTGGKAALVEARPDLFPLDVARVHLPFIGGGAPFFMRYAGRKNVTISDANPRLVNLYQQVRTFPDHVASRLEELVAAYESWRDVDAQRSFFESQRAALDIDTGMLTTAAARFLFILRWGFNGLYRENGAGVCNTPHGDGKPKRVDRDHLRACSKALAHAEIRHEDFVDTLNRARVGDFVYVDPPYAPLSKTASFTGYVKGGEWGVGERDRIRLVGSLPYLYMQGVRFVVSDSDTPENREAYKQWQVETVEMPRRGNCRADKRGPVTELVVRSWRTE